MHRNDFASISIAFPQGAESSRARPAMIAERRLFVVIAAPPFIMQGPGSSIELRVPLKAEVAERWVIVGATAEWPVIFALAILDRQVVDAGDAPPHQAVLVELPVLVAIAAKPVAGIVVPFICKAHGDPIVAERPHFLDQPIIELAIPFAREKRLDLRPAVNELGAIAPDA